MRIKCATKFFMRYFETLQTASLEKVHSAALVWLFSKENTELSTSDKLGLVQALGDRSEICSEIVRTYTEYKDIDVLVEMSDHVLAIENKIKIGEHSNQLAKYDDILDEDFPRQEKIKVFLSWIGEPPSQTGWIAKDYRTLLDKLKKLSPSGQILKDYLENLELLVGCIEKFKKNHCQFQKVFSEGHKKKHQKDLKDYDNDLSRYIAANGLETNLQRAFLYKLKEAVSIEAEHIIIEETRGTALIDYKTLKKVPQITVEGHQFDTGIQIQGNTIKVQIEVGLDKDGKRKKADKGDSEVLQVFAKHTYQNNWAGSKTWRLNMPHRKDIAYISISRPLLSDFDKKSFAENSFENCVQAVGSGFDQCLEALNLFKETSESFRTVL